MVNRSKLITSIKMKLGLHGLSLPFMDINEAIEDVIDEETMTTFNELQPNIVRFTLDTNQLKCLRNSYDESIYVIPDVFGGREILGVENIIPFDKYRMSSAGYTNSDSFMIGGLMMGQLEADISSLLEPVFTFDFKAPNLIHLYNLDMLHNTLDCTFKVEHAANLSTIPKTCYTSLKKLALLDCKIFLYEQLKHYEELETVHGRISLKISDWSDAQSQRDELVKEWEDTYHFDGTQIY